MKKKIIIIICIIIVLIFLIPKQDKLEDGGSTEYRSLVYKVTKVHKLNEVSVTGYEEGWIIEIFGFEIYNKTYPIIT